MGVKTGERKGKTFQFVEWFWVELEMECEVSERASVFGRCRLVHALRKEVGESGANG